MDILGLTSTESIRSLLGIDVRSNELDDSVFSDMAIDESILLEFLTWMPVPLSTFTAMMSTNSTVKLALRGCARYTGALLFIPQLATMTASKQSDGQNEFQRQTRDLEEMKKSLTETLEKYKALLLGEIPLETTSVSFIEVASPTYDPVTGI